MSSIVGTLPELSRDEEVRWRVSLRATRIMLDALERAVAGSGMPLHEYDILDALAHAEMTGSGSMRMSELAELLVESRSRLSRAAARLEARGWVVRTPSPRDGRGVDIALTDAGSRAAASMGRSYAAAVRRHFVDTMPAEELERLSEILVKVCVANGADVDRVLAERMRMANAAAR